MLYLPQCFREQIIIFNGLTKMLQFRPEGNVMKRSYYLIRLGEFWHCRLNRESGLAESKEVTWYTKVSNKRKDAEIPIENFL
jgi:hypothetical protein